MTKDEALKKYAAFVELYLNTYVGTRTLIGPWRDVALCMDRAMELRSIQIDFDPDSRDGRAAEDQPEPEEQQK